MGRCHQSIPIFVVCNPAKKWNQQVDRDGNGTLTFLELSCRLSDMGFDEDDITPLFQTMDTNNDGVIDLEEFEKGFEEYQEYADEDAFPMCVEAAPSNISGVANPHRQPAMEDAGDGCEPPAVATEEKHQEKKKSKSKSKSSSSTSSPSSSSNDDSDDDFPMCVEAQSSVIKGVANPN